MILRYSNLVKSRVTSHHTHLSRKTFINEHKFPLLHYIRSFNISNKKMHVLKIVFILTNVFTTLYQTTEYYFNYFESIIQTEARTCVRNIVKLFIRLFQSLPASKGGSIFVSLKLHVVTGDG